MNDYTALKFHQSRYNDLSREAQKVRMARLVRPIQQDRKRKTHFLLGLLPMILRR